MSNDNETNTSNELELRAILNTEEFGSPKWEAASDELHQISVDDIETNPVKLGLDWCTTDGQWWY
jgi:hypothetical protein